MRLSSRLSQARQLMYLLPVQPDRHGEAPAEVITKRAYLLWLAGTVGVVVLALPTAMLVGLFSVCWRVSTGSWPLQLAATDPPAEPSRPAARVTKIAGRRVVGRVYDMDDLPEEPF